MCTPTFSIQVPILEGIEIDELKEVCKRYGCEIDKRPRDIYYTITSEDPLNFFWLGMNFNHSLGIIDLVSEIKKNNPSLYR